MYKTKTSGSLRNAMSATAGATANQPVVEIQSYALAGAGLARVMIEVTHNEASRNDSSVVASALRNRLDGKMEVVAGSFQTLEKGMFTERMTGMVAAVRQAIPVTEDSAKAFKAVASNMFMDDEKDMWVLRKTEAGQLFVKTTGIDDDMSLIGMLDACASSGFRNRPEFGRQVAQASAVANSVEGGQFVSYVNSDNIIANGFVVACVMGEKDEEQIVVLPVGATEGETIQKAAVTEIHAMDDFPSMEQTGEDEVATVVAAARGGIDIQFLLDYYKKVFARSPKYYEMFAARIQSHQFM